MATKKYKSKSKSSSKKKARRIRADELVVIEKLLIIFEKEKSIFLLALK